MRQWLADLVLGHIKLFSTELFWKKIHFLHSFLQNSIQIISNYYFFIYFSFFYKLKKITPNSLVTVWYALRVSQQPTVSLNYSQSIKINMAPSDGGTIISSSNRPTVIYLTLKDAGGGLKVPTGQEIVCHFSQDHARVTKILDFIHKHLI